ncbi:hypothetical protein ACLOJK_038048 [Asimina triloba]
MAESAVNFLIEYMGPLLVDEVKLLKGVRGEARKIRDELESMRAFLRDADAREDSNESIKIWVRQEALNQVQVGLPCYEWAGCFLIIYGLEVWNRCF